MKNILFSLFAVALAGVAAIAATTAMLNTPVHNIGPPPADKKPDGTPSTPAPGDRPATPEPIPDADKPGPGGETKPAPGGEAKPAPGGEAKPAEEPSGGAKPSGGTTAEAGKEEESDKDPYEGIAPEDLPPDLQYDADSSVSFPTNT
ncbi:MAG TPA: hypothetical protein VM146_10925 [Steroidobacteraceae bacterium]|nr:hypothetical protein [Steroidobacteraceae bacterium]